MILEEFDFDRDAIIRPERFVKPIENFPEVTVSCFSDLLFEAVLEKYPHRKIGYTKVANWGTYIYEIEYKGKKFAYYNAPEGEAACVEMYEVIHFMGSKKLILTGNCGVLDNTIPDCGIIIPTEAFRDEGTSWHYLPPSDSIPVNHKYVDLFKQTCAELGYPTVEGATWTTDAIYRETRAKMEKRKSQGCICVEMETAGMQAMCDFNHTDFFQYYYAGDNLDTEQWDPRSVECNVRLNDKIGVIELGFEFGLKLMEL